MVCICSEALSPLLCPSLPAQWFPGVPLQHLHAISSPAALAAPACWRWGCWEPGQLGESSKKWVLADLSFLKLHPAPFPSEPCCRRRWTPAQAPCSIQTNSGSCTDSPPQGWSGRGSEATTTQNSGPHNTRVLASSNALPFSKPPEASHFSKLCIQ